MPHGKINPFTITQKINGTDAYLACLALIESLKLIIFSFFLKKAKSILSSETLNFLFRIFFTFLLVFRGSLALMVFELNFFVIPSRICV